MLHRIEIGILSSLFVSQLKGGRMDIFMNKKLYLVIEFVASVCTIIISFNKLICIYRELIC